MPYRMILLLRCHFKSEEKGSASVMEARAVRPISKSRVYQVVLHKIKKAHAIKGSFYGDDRMIREICTDCELVAIFDAEIW